MARQYAKFYVTVWGSDFRQLTRGAQHLYLQLVSNPKLSAAGCVTIQPRKWANQSADATAAEIETDLTELATKRYVLVDDDTEELLIRSFIRHDRGHRNQFLRKSIESAITAIESPTLREHARLELAAAIEDAANPQVEDSEQDSYEDPSEDWYQDANEDAWQANYRPQLQPHPSTSPSAATSNAGSSRGGKPKCSPVDDGAAAAAVAFELYVKHREDEVRPANPEGFRIHMNQTERHDRMLDTADHLDLHPDHDAALILQHVYGLGELEVWKLTGQARRSA